MNIVPIANYRKLYGGIILLSIFLVIAATGGGLFNSAGHWLGDWQHKAFRLLCHQDPARSFWINGKPMAVCARCYGLYTGFTLLWIILPLLGSVVNKINSYNGHLFIAVLGLNILDVIGNLVGLWHNTSITRLIMGSFIGLAVVLFLAEEFLKTEEEPERDIYGYNRTI